MGRFVNPDEDFIDYRLNILGIRVRAGVCQLIGRKGEEWHAFGAPQPLPLTVPTSAQILGGKADELQVTASQFMTENPGSDLAAVLSQSLNFAEAVRHQAEATA
jgi:hypothetical protein